MCTVSLRCNIACLAKIFKDLKWFTISAQEFQMLNLEVILKSFHLIMPKDNGILQKIDNFFARKII